MNMAKKKNLACGLAMLVSLVISTALFIETRNGPLQHWTEWNQTDGHYYDLWARSIVAGDYLCRDVPVPVIQWQTTVAESWMKKDPKLASEMSAEAAKFPGRTAASMLWERSLGRHRYYQEPAYQYGIALIYALTDSNIQAVFIVQLLLGVLTVGLIFAVTNRYFDLPTATLAALMCALCAPLQMHQLILLRDAPICCMGLLLVWLTSRADDDPRGVHWFLLGLAVGGSLLLKSIFTTYLLCLLAIMPRACGWQWKRTAVAWVMLAAGIVVMLLPLVARNVAVGVSPFALAGNAAYAFVQNNSSDYRWDTPTPMGKSLIEVLKPSGNEIIPTIAKTFATHDSVRSLFMMYAWKFDAVWHWWARPDNACFYAWRCASKVLAWLPVTFTLVAPLALSGLVMGLRSAWRRMPLYLLVCTAFAPLLLFATLERFRLLLLVACIPFAAWLVTSFIKYIRSGQRLQAGIIAVVVLAAACWTSRPLPDHLSRYRPADFNVMFELSYRKQMQAALNSDRYDEAIRLGEEMLGYAPSFVRRIAAGYPPDETPNPAVASLFANLHNDCGTLGLKTGNPTAHTHLDAAARIYAFTNSPAR